MTSVFIDMHLKQRNAVRPCSTNTPLLLIFFKLISCTQASSSDFASAASSVCSFYALDRVTVFETSLTVSVDAVTRAVMPVLEGGEGGVEEEADASEPEPGRQQTVTRRGGRRRTRS